MGVGMPTIRAMSIAVAASGSSGVGATNLGAASGVVAGLVIGKPLGVVFASWLSVKVGICSLPRGVDWKGSRHQGDDGPYLSAPRLCAFRRFIGKPVNSALAAISSARQRCQ